MSHRIETAKCCCDRYQEVVSYFQDPFLLLIRLYWGLVLIVAGWGKLTNVEAVARFFESIDIFWPTFNAVLSEYAEFLCGGLLLLGLASRVVPWVIIFNMTVAYLTAHTEQALALFSKWQEFVSAPPFLYLFASAIVLLFGPRPGFRGRPAEALPEPPHRPGYTGKREDKPTRNRRERRLEASGHAARSRPADGRCHRWPCCRCRAPRPWQAKPAAKGRWRFRPGRERCRAGRRRPAC